MKKIIAIMLAALMLAGVATVMSSCGDNDTVIVQTNAFFAPFEYYEGDKIVGVDVDVMNKVGEKLGKKIEFKNVEFAVIIENVAAGKVCDCGAAGITITDARKEKVDFSVPYFTSVQYVIFPDGSDIETVDGRYIVWEALSGKKIGVQTDTTGMIYVDGEINATEDNDYGYAGVLYGTNTEYVNFDNVQLAADAIGKRIDYVVIDKLPAEFVVGKNGGLKCLPLYYAGGEGEEDAPVEEEYAICVTKGNDELLKAINEVLNEMIANGEIESLVAKHMGLDK